MPWQKDETCRKRWREGEGKTEDRFNYNDYREDERKKQQTAPLVGDEADVHHFNRNSLCERFEDVMVMK